MNIRNHKKFIIGILTIVLLFNIFTFTIINNYSSAAPGDEIQIITPENIIYTEPMAGYYAATYGFENDIIGGNPTGWTIYEFDSNTVDIIESKGSHNKVVELHDTGNGYTFMYKFFDSSHTYGTVEFWYLVDWTSDHDNRILIQDDYTNIVDVIVRDTTFYYRPSMSETIVPNAPSVSDNTWYHIRIDFELTTGEYLGLSQYKCRISIDGSDSGELDLDFNQPKATRVYIDTWENDDANFYVYYDAIGYSWDPNYNIGDNLNEGLLLSYTTTEELDWKGYSLDGQTNKTILGNTTIPLPNDGQHTIQVYGNNSLDIYFESNIRDFSVYHINILTPEEKAYTEPMLGRYPGTYSFENDEIGADPEGWIVNESGGTVNVVDVIGGHNKVLDLYDTSGVNGVFARQNFQEDQSEDGISIEYWHRTTDFSSGSEIRIFDSIAETNTLILLGKHDDNSVGVYSYWNGIWNNVAPCLNNIWYHHRIIINFTSQSYDWYIDGNLGGDDILFYESDTKIRRFFFMSYTGDDNYHDYYDAIDYSWDPNYNVGDNLNEGLLLSFTNSTELDWMGYSLDGQTNKTISGNTTIIMPQEGLHTIQVFGNNTSGSYYTSDISQFIIDFFAPYLLLPSDIYYIEGETGNYLIWAAIDVNPAIYIIRVNGSVESSGQWTSNSPIQINIDGLSPGVYAYEFEISDQAGHITVDTVTVTVYAIEEEPTIPFGFEWILFSIISIIGLLIYVRKRIKF